MQNLNNALIESIKSPGIVDLTRYLGEIPLDACLDDGLLKELPIVGTFVGLAKTVVSIRDQLFLRKICRFLFCLSDISIEDRKKFVQDLSDERKEKVGESVIGALDRIENVEKSDIIGSLFKAYVNNVIDLDTLRRLISKVCACSLPDLQALKRICSGEKIDDLQIYSDLANNGLMELTVIDGNGTVPEHYEITTHGSRLVEHGMP